MSSLKTVDFNIHYVNTLLQNKGKGSLTVIQNFINEIEVKRRSWEKSIPEYKEKQEKLIESRTQAQEPFVKLLQDKESKMFLMTEEYQNKLNLYAENREKLKKQLLILKIEEQKKAIEDQILTLEEHTKKTNENLALLPAKHKSIIETLNIKQQEFLQNIKDELLKLDEEILNTKGLIQKASNTQLKLDNLHHAVSKNPNTLFNDGISHDLVLFAHRDSDFKLVLNNFLENILQQKNYQQTIDKVGKLMEEVYQKSKGMSVLELISIYSKLLVTINQEKEGASILDKPMIKFFVNPEVEKALRQYREDLSILEIIQIAKLSPEIHQKVLSQPICADFFIQLLRSEMKMAKKKGQHFIMPTIEWDALIYLTTKWPIFFKKFGQSLNSFDEHEYIKMFQNTIEYANLILKNPSSEKVFFKILSLRDQIKDTFQKSFDTKDFIQLLYDTVAMAKPNDFRCPHHLEVLKIYSELKEPFKSNFIQLFDPLETTRMFKQAESVAIELQENLYLKIVKNIEIKNNFLSTFKVDKVEDIPRPILRFFQTIRVDVGDHLAQLDNILEKLNHFEKNIGLSVVSSDRQIPIANSIYQSVIKCSEYIDNPQAFERLCVTKELDKMLSRRVNFQKEQPK